MKKLRGNKIVPVEDFEHYQEESESFIFELKNEPTKEQKVNSWLEKITINCQNILKAIFYYRETIDSLMQKMGWKNKHTASTQQYKCIQQIKKQKDKEEK